jgi:hypothetical protein
MYVSSTVRELKLCPSDIIVFSKNNSLAHDGRYGLLIFER